MRLGPYTLTPLGAVLIVAFVAAIAFATFGPSGDQGLGLAAAVLIGLVMLGGLSVDRGGRPTKSLAERQRRVRSSTAHAGG